MSAGERQEGTDDEEKEARHGWEAAMSHEDHRAECAVPDVSSADAKKGNEASTGY